MRDARRTTEADITEGRTGERPLRKRAALLRVGWSVMIVVPLLLAPAVTWADAPVAWVGLEGYRLSMGLPPEPEAEAKHAPGTPVLFNLLGQPGNRVDRIRICGVPLD